MEPLAGLLVVDLTRYLPGPFASRELLELGARVVRLEAPGGDPLRELAPAWHEALNAGKESVTCDLKADPATGRRLCAEADVVLESFRPGVVERLGVGPGDLPETVVYCSFTGFGPDDLRAGHDLNYQGYAGLLADTAPALPPVPIADLAAGALAAVTQILAALLERERTGRGRRLTISLTHGAHRLVSYRLGGEPSRAPADRRACVLPDLCDRRLPVPDRRGARAEVLPPPLRAARQAGARRAPMGSRPGAARGRAGRGVRPEAARGLARALRGRGRGRRPGRDTGRGRSSAGWKPEGGRQREQVRQAVVQLRVAASRSSRKARSMPAARAPSTSSSGESPTIAAAAGSTSRRSRTAWKIVGCGFVRPKAPEPSAASTSSRWCATNSSRSRPVLETRPSFSPCSRSAPRTGSASS